MPSITPANLEQAVRELAAENPDFIYRSVGFDGGCHYFPTPPANPLGCIIGAAVRRLGHDLSQECEGEGAEAVLSDIWGSTFHRSGEAPYELVRRHLATNWFGRVQVLQDRGHPWLTAVSTADADGYPKPSTWIPEAADA